MNVACGHGGELTTRTATCPNQNPKGEGKGRTGVFDKSLLLLWRKVSRSAFFLSRFVTTERVGGDCATINSPIDRPHHGSKSDAACTVIVWKLDRLSRRLRDGINVLADWCERGLKIVVITQQIELNGAVGRMIAALLLGLAELLDRVGVSSSAA